MDDVPLSPRDTLVTPDAVVLDLETAGVGSRSIALLVDVVVLFVAFFLVNVGFGLLLGLGGDEGTTLAALIVFLVVLPIAYPLVFEATWNGRTLGKAALGLRVVTATGGRIGWRHAAMRAVIGLFELWATMGAVAFISAMISERGQRLGDMAAGTLVIRARTGHRPATPLQVRANPQLATLAEATTGRLTTEEYGVVRSLVERFSELEPGRRRELSIRLADRLRPRLGHPPAGTAPEDWLVAAVVSHQQAVQAASLASMPPPTMAPPPAGPPSMPPPQLPPPGG